MKYSIKWIFCFTIGLVFILLSYILPQANGMSPAAAHTLGLMLAMAVWWSTETLPLPVTSLLPMALFPLLSIIPATKTFAAYADPIIYLFFAGFLLGKAIEKHNLHRRIALTILFFVGTSKRALVAGIMLTTGLLSMWVSNTAVAVVMLPIALSIVNYFDEKIGVDKKFNESIMLSVAYAASIGGIATLIGTPPNAFLAAFLHNTYNLDITFASWMLIGVPVSIAMMVVAYFVLAMRFSDVASSGAQFTLEIREMKLALGKVSRGEILVAIVFALMALFWVIGPYVGKLLSISLGNTQVGMLGVLLLFVIPVDLEKREFILDWNHAKEIPWGVLLLFGGGLALAAAIKDTGLANWFASEISGYSLPIYLYIVIITAVIIFLTEINSNTATTASFLPLLSTLAIAAGFAPAMFAIPVALAASCAFMLPIATPPNAVLFSSGYIAQPSMMKVGVILNIVGIIIIPILTYFLATLVV